jgi:cell division protein FtsN
MHRCQWAMTIDNDDHSESGNDPSPQSGTDPRGDNERREPRFGRFDERDMDEYEEPDRDTDYSSGYGIEDVAEEVEIDDSFSEKEEGDLLPPESEDPPTPLPPVGSEPDLSVIEDTDDWLEDEESVEEDENDGPSWPPGLIAVAAVALVLLAAGIYGVMQERAATQEELRELRATLATSGNPEEVRTNRESLREMQQSYDTLAAETGALSLENRRLTETVAGLEAKLRAQQGAQKEEAPANQVTPASNKETTSPPPPEQPPVAAVPIASKPTVKKPISPVSSGQWFVNVASYSSRATAESRASGLRPIAGKVVVVPGTKDNKTYYRVRVVGLTGKGSANEVARKLEAELRVFRLWVGQD